MPTLPPVIEIDKTPVGSKEASPYTWADFIELLCLVNIDRRISKLEVLDRIGESQDIGMVEEFGPRESPSDLDFYLAGPVGAVEAPDYLQAEIDDRSRQLVNRWFEHLEFRQEAFGGFYPFALRRGVLYCKEDIDGDPKCKLYIFLLLSSNLKYLVDKTNEGFFTERFEIASMVALKSYLPRRAKVRLVGKNALNRGPYRGSFRHKIETLSAEIKDRVSSRCDLDKLKGKTGDGGLDLMAQVPFKDVASGKLLLFCQCGCGMKWESKQLEAHALNWTKYITFTIDPCNMVFIPRCFRGADGNWFDQMTITACILVDRLRLVHLLRDRLQMLQRLHPYDELVDQVLAYREALT